MFQSHPDPIASSLNEMPRQFELSFNPTLIQLRANQDGDVQTLEICFNPTLIQLRDTTPINAITVKPSFNPTLIQLRVMWTKGRRGS